ncbi:hypothetical protein [Sphingomicrobium lutaoense]|uniref:Drug/metabolite transporter (DMT)-like permease n=1 Tax=Sphingomicrobium lutaoense TaxID=515949 RepID=A0A839YZX3_9SPHN|nr:hypothetical protein [Sphingomicrobium lutaoense]MBB3764556.1 drug/metabolite transporter (DMT)-like permease [Sphingomicrobium lutaoense]
MRSHPGAVGILLFFILLGGGARYAIGSIYGRGEAIKLVDTLASSGLYLGSASATASATILALMLTITSMIRRLDADFDDDVWRRVNRVAQVATISLMASLALLLALVFPVGEFEELPSDWFIWLYNVLFAITVMVIALLAMTVALLYTTIRDVISKITPTDDV